MTVGKKYFLLINLCRLSEKSTCKVLMTFENEVSLISGIGNIASKCQISCRKLSQTKVSSWSLIAPGNSSSTNICSWSKQPQYRLHVLEIGSNDSSESKDQGFEWPAWYLNPKQTCISINRHKARILKDRFSCSSELNSVTAQSYITTTYIYSVLLRQGFPERAPTELYEAECFSRSGIRSASQ